MSHPYRIYEVLLLATVALSWACVPLIRRYSLASGLIDTVGVRSSHAVPTPRGAGLGIAIAVVCSVLVSAFLGIVPWRPSLAIVCGGAMVAAIGWFDDHRSLSARRRIAVHFVAAGFALWLIGAPHVLMFGSRAIAAGPLAWPLGLLAIVWSLNAYNFMDGVDGLAGIEAVSVASFAAAILVSSGHAAVAFMAALVAAAAAGFLPWNWPPARIFMGDVGSGFLGFVFAVVAFWSESAGGLSALAWSGLLALFVVDATVTLARRVLRRERFYEAHRQHAYQRLYHQANWSHRRIVVSVFACNLILAVIVASGWYGSRLGIATGTCFALAIIGYAWVERIAPMPTGG